MLTHSGGHNYKMAAMQACNHGGAVPHCCTAVPHHGYPAPLFAPPPREQQAQVHPCHFKAWEGGENENLGGGKPQAQSHACHFRTLGRGRSSKYGAVLAAWGVWCLGHALHLGLLKFASEVS